MPPRWNHAIDGENGVVENTAGHISQRSFHWHGFDFEIHAMRATSNAISELQKTRPGTKFVCSPGAESVSGFSQVGNDKSASVR